MQASKILQLLLLITTISIISCAGPAKYKKSEVNNNYTKTKIWDAAMEVMKDYDIDKMNKEEGYISTNGIERSFPAGIYIIYVKVYDNYFEVKADVKTGNKMYKGSYEEKEKEIINKIENRLNK